MSYDSNTSGTTWDGIWQVCKDLADGTDSRPYSRNTDGTTTIDGILDALTNLRHGGDNSPYASNSESVTLNGILMAVTDLVKGTNNVASYPDNTDPDTFDSLLVIFKDWVLGTDSSPYADNVPGVTLSGILTALKNWNGPRGAQATMVLNPFTVSSAGQLDRQGGLIKALGAFTLSAAIEGGPTRSANPVITGTPTSGSVLTVTPGSYNGNPAPTVTRQLYLYPSLTPISGATGLTYRIPAAYEGMQILCIEIADNGLGTATGTSNIITVLAPTLDGVPALSVTSDIDDNTPDGEGTVFDVLAGDLVRFQLADDDQFTTNIIDMTDTLSGPLDTSATFHSGSTLSDGIRFLRGRLERWSGGNVTAVGAWSSTVEFEILTVVTNSLALANGADGLALANGTDGLSLV